MMAPVSAVGSRVLAEIEEGSLDEVLASFREKFRDGFVKHPGTALQDVNVTTSHPRTTTQSRQLKRFPIPTLDDLVARHFRATQSAPLVVGGRHLPLVYLVVATLIASPHDKALVVVDLESRFDVTRVFECTPYTEKNPGTGPTLGRGGGAIPKYYPTTAEPAACPRVTVSDLTHVHVCRPAHVSQEHLSEVVASAQEFMLYGQHSSHGREWWGTIVVGGSGTSGNIAMTATWKGWLRVDRQELAGHPIGLSAEEALLERDRRQQAFDDAPWVASSVWGNLLFNEG